MTAATARLNPTMYGDQVTCLRGWPGMECGALAVVRVLVACVHEHVRLVVLCMACHNRGTGACRVCFIESGDRNHECELVVIRTEPLAVTS